MQDARLKAHPCSVRVWNAELGFTFQTQDPRDCIKLSSPRVLEGDWFDFAYGGGFRLNGLNSGIVYSVSTDGTTRANLQWRAGIRSPPKIFTGRAFHVRIIGRVGRRDGSVFDAGQDVLVVDRILDARLLENPVGPQLLRNQANSSTSQ